jgi:trigger factor
MTIDRSNLQISVEDQERWRRRMSVTVPASVVAEEEQKAAAKLAKRMNLKGFRKGRVPSKVVESRFGGALRQETLDKVIGEAYRHALASEELHPISEGEIEDLTYEPEQDLVFSIAFDVQPEIELARLGGFAVERPLAEVNEDQLQEVLQGIQKQNGAWTPVEEGPAEDGDLVSVEIRKIDDEDLAAEPKEYELVLGEGQAIPGVEDAIKSLELGATGEFDVTFPEDFPDEGRRGESERVEIHVVARKSLELPELDDALAKQLGDFETFDDLVARVREDLEKDAAHQSEGVVRGRLLDFVMDANPFEVPRSMVERYVETILGGQEKLPEERLEEVKSSIRPEAERAVKRILVIDRVAETQHLTATEADLDERIEEIARLNDTAPEKVYASLQKSGRLESLEREVTEGKVFDFLKEQSEITEMPAV